MNEFLRVAYGDPCRECGFEWSVGPATCDAIVSGAPARFNSLLAGQDGSKAHPSLHWNAAAYVVHVADVLRIWSDRIAAVALGASDPVVPYDEDRLGDARGYGSSRPVRGCDGFAPPDTGAALGSIYCSKIGM